MSNRLQRSWRRFFSSTNAALALLSPSSRRRFWILVVAQMSTGFLDLIGAGLITLVVLLLVNAFQASPTSSSFIQTLHKFPLTQHYSLIKLAVIIGTCAAFFFLLKSLLCLSLIHRNLRFLGDQHAQIVSDLTTGLLRKNLLFAESKSSQEMSYALLIGTSYLTIELLGPLAIGLSEGTLLLLFAILMLWINPILMVCTVLFFGSVGIILHRILGNWAANVGEIVSETSSASQREVQETLANFRSITVFGRQDFFVSSVKAIVEKGAIAHSTKRFIEQIPKFTLEVTLVLGVLALGVSQIKSSNLASASATLAIFLTIAVRSTPSMLRLQGVFIAMRNASGQAKETLDFIARLDDEPDRIEIGRLEDEIAISDFSPNLLVSNVCFSYPNQSEFSVANVSFELQAGQSLAIVGKSGAGKSTLVDVILGLLVPQKGNVLLGGEDPQVALELWRNRIAYIPQETKILSRTIAENVAIGIPQALIDMDAVRDALNRVQLSDFVEDLPLGLDTVIGDRGINLSGGQRQRLGLSRALYLNPEFLVLDEATSALDPETEEYISHAISNLFEHATVISIAHRLATVRSADYVLYLEHGKCQAFGTFDEVRRLSPNFERHAKLLGM